jgi:ribose transport system permease protein
MVNVVRQSSIIGIIACGMTFVIISGNFDLSVGSVCGFAGAMAVYTSNNHSIWLGVIAAVAIGAAIGLTNGLLVTKLFISSFIVTLGTMVITRGMLYMFSGGYPISGMKTQFLLFGQGSLGGIPVPILLFLIVIIVTHIALNETKFGKYIYAIGGNIEASQLSGIYIDFYRIIGFVLSGALASLAGIIVASRVNVATPIAGTNYELDAIAAVVIGGTSIMGGEGSIPRTVIGVLLLTILGNGFNMLNVNIYMQYLFKGVIIIGAVGFDTYSRHRKPYST